MKALYIISLVLAFTISFVATQGLTALPYLGQVRALTNYGSNYFYMDLERARQDPERKKKLFFSISYRKGYYIKTKWLNFYYCYSNVADPYSCTFERKSRYYSRTMSGRNYRYYKVDNEADNYRYILLDFEFPYSIPDAITVGSMRSQTGW